MYVYERDQRALWTGKTCLITGAGSGIGRALAERLARLGAVVHAADIDLPALESLHRTYPTVRATPLDVNSRTEFIAAINGLVAEAGHLDLIVNNAGIVVAGNLEDMTPDAWERLMGVNLWGVIHGTQAAYRQMLRQGSGQIVNVASSAGFMPVHDLVGYTTTKYGVTGMTLALREAARRHGIKVSVVAPGLVDTAIFNSATNVGDADYAESVKRIPLTKISPDQAASDILTGLARNKARIVFPVYNRVLLRLYSVMPRVTMGLVGRG